MSPSAIFINRDSEVLIRVREVDDSYAYIERLDKDGGHYSMPVADYDENFVEAWKPATQEELARLTSAKFRLPANAPKSWGETP